MENKEEELAKIRDEAWKKARQYANKYHDGVILIYLTELESAVERNGPKACVRSPFLGDYYCCPSCGAPIGEMHFCSQVVPKFCKYCGQRTTNPKE